ncbi:MAG TPA: hypothetical protein PLZ16_10925, partial [Gammaproteobacteria bacterium]|nr:hypothetical protein [Gammaproteobacteria bacterium]
HRWSPRGQEGAFDDAVAQGVREPVREATSGGLEDLLGDHSGREAKPDAAIRIETEAFGNTEPRVPYPAATDGVTAGEWNRAARATSASRSACLPTRRSFRRTSNTACHCKPGRVIARWRTLGRSVQG